MIDTITTMFAIEATTAAIAMASISANFRYELSARKLRRQRDSAIEALRNEEVEGAHFRELADDALANIEDLQGQVVDERAAANKWAAMYTLANSELRKLHAEHAEAAARRKAHMRDIGIIGNQSRKRRKQAAA